MSKAVLMSIQPYWVFLIIAKTMGWNIGDEKTVEVRKNYPKSKNWNKVVKIYCSKDKKSFTKIPREYQPFMKQLLGKVIGEFVCDDIVKIQNLMCIFTLEERSNVETNLFARLSCLNFDDMKKYLGDKDGYAWHISDIVIYDKPKELSEFYRHDTSYDNSFGGYFEDRDKRTPIKRPPQSWYYVEEV